MSYVCRPPQLSVRVTLSHTLRLTSLEFDPGYLAKRLSVRHLDSARLPAFLASRSSAGASSRRPAECAPEFRRISGDFDVAYSGA